MKQLLSLAAIAAMLSATGCTQQEILVEEGENGEPATLGISTGVLTTNTKSVVGGDAITYIKANYASEALGLGVVVLNEAGNALYSGGDISADHVWFMGDEKGENWKSISAKGDNFVSATAAPYTLNEAVGTVYAYYPKTSTVTGTSSSALTVPAPLQTSGTIAIDAGVSNADLRFDSSTSNWVANTPTANKKKIICAPDVTDYLYANNSNRKVSDGRAAGSPGRSIDLVMVHALTMVSFRLYNDGTLPGNGDLTKIVLQNATGKTLLKTTSGATMKLADGEITNLSDNTSDKLTRTISGYTIPKEIKAGETQTSTTYIKTATVTGPKVARKISILAYPISTFTEDDIEAVFTIDGKEYPVKIPVSEVNAWTAGSNTVYSVCASQRKLEVTSVSVIPWDEIEGGNIDI